MRPWPGLERYERSLDLSQSGLRLYTYDAGPAEAPPLVLIHGLGDEADTWRHVLDPLAVGHRVVAPDLPGFGRSDKPRRPYTIPFFSGAVLDLMDVLSLDRAVLIGHSLGAALAHHIALKWPDRVRGLVLIGGSLWIEGQVLNPALLLFVLPGVGERLYTRLRGDPDAAYASLRPYYADLDALPQADQAFLYQRVNERVWSDGQRRAFLSTLRYQLPWQALRQRGLKPQLGALDVPTLVVWGEADQVVSPENGRALVGVQPSARLVTVAGAGHHVHGERPSAFLRLLAADERLGVTPDLADT